MTAPKLRPCTCCKSHWPESLAKCGRGHKPITLLRQWPFDSAPFYRLARRCADFVPTGFQSDDDSESPLYEVVKS